MSGQHNHFESSPVDNHKTALMWHYTNQLFTLEIILVEWIQKMQILQMSSIQVSTSLLCLLLVISWFVEQGISAYTYQCLYPNGCIALVLLTLTLLLPCAGPTPSSLLTSFSLQNLCLSDDSGKVISISQTYILQPTSSHFINLKTNLRE